MNILIVDDDRSVQRVLTDALTKEGFTVTVEQDGEWGVKAFKQKRFDAVLLDLLLPALSGYEVAKQIRSLPRGKQVPIVMISGIYKSLIHQREAVAKHGAFALLEKPLDLGRLLDTLKEALGDRYPRPSPPKPPPPPLEEDPVTAEFSAQDTDREEADEVERDFPTAPTDRHPSPELSSPQIERKKTRRQPASQSKKKAAKEAPWASLKDKSFAEVLADAYRSRFTGAVRLRRGNVKKIVYFRDGTPVFVKSNLLIECLGRILVREKMISDAECEESLRRMKESQRLQGTVLIEMGCISPHNLQHSLVLQMRHKIYDVFSWDEGEYQFIERAPLPSEPLSLDITCAQLIHEGVKHAYGKARLSAAFSGLDRLYVLASNDPLYALQEAGLGSEERELLGLADGRKTLATLRALGVLPPFETDRFFFAMKCAQMIVFEIHPLEAKRRPSFAEMAAARPKPPPLPPAIPGPAMAPPASSHKAPPAHPSDPPLELPWRDARLAQPMARIDPTVPGASVEPPQKNPEAVIAKSAGSLLPELSEVVSLPRLTGQEGARREKLAATLAAMRGLDYFELLGVKQDATREDIKRAYFALAKEYHPDKHFSSASTETRALAQQIYDLISAAHDQLTDPEQRQSYIAEMERGAPRPSDANVGRILAAEGKFQRGEELMRQRQYGGALSLFQEAISLCPDEGEFHAWRGWALFQDNPSRAEDALRSLEEAVLLNSKLDKAYLFMGYIHKATGRPDRAERQFEKAIQCNPDCTEALRELRLLGKQRR